MLIDPKLNGYLYRSLSHEMTAVQQYLTQSTLCGLWGLQEAALKFDHEAKEELDHAKRLTRHMLGMGLLPNNTQLATVRATHNLEEMLTADWYLESDVIRLYSEASQYSARKGDEISFELFNTLLQEEREHLSSIENWLSDLKTNKVG